MLLNFLNHDVIEVIILLSTIYIIISMRKRVRDKKNLNITQTAIIEPPQKIIIQNGQAVVASNAFAALQPNDSLTGLTLNLDRSVIFSDGYWIKLKQLKNMTHLTIVSAYPLPLALLKTLEVGSYNGPTCFLVSVFYLYKDIFP